VYTTCSRVLNLRDVSSFFLSVSSSRLAYSKICFCCSAIFPLQFRRHGASGLAGCYIWENIFISFGTRQLHIYSQDSLSPPLNHLLLKASCTDFARIVSIPHNMISLSKIICRKYWKSNSLMVIPHTYTVQPPFHVPWFKVFLHLTLNFNEPKSVISMPNFLHLEFPSV
jgi:hypothetical protein